MDRTQAVTDDLTGLPRLQLATLPTPLEQASKLAAHAGLGELWIKRDDLSGYALGGNKLRQIDFILADATGRGADIVVATAGSQSNFCRALAGGAVKTGLACHLHLRGALGTATSGNLLVDEVLGARVSFTAHTDPWEPAIREELDAIARQYRQEGRIPYVTQLTGSSARHAIAGWVGGAAELTADFARLGIAPDVIVVGAGSGLSAGGLALGFRHLGRPTRVVAVSVQQPASRLKPWLLDQVNAASASFGFAARLTGSDFDLLDAYIGPGYGLPSDDSVAAVRLVGRLEGLVLDPVYTGKAMAGLLALAAGGALAGKSVVFLHSGGLPGLFHHAAAFGGATA